jgi:hypothetical protein
MVKDARVIATPGFEPHRSVERTTGRRVLAFQTSMSPEHGLIVEAFVLAPAAA